MFLQKIIDIFMILYYNINKKSVEYKSKQYADFIINNNGDLLDLENQIIKINNN